jgi:hypothetical protein
MKCMQNLYEVDKFTKTYPVVLSCSTNFVVCNPLTRLSSTLSHQPLPGATPCLQTLPPQRLLGFGYSALMVPGAARGEARRPTGDASGSLLLLRIRRLRCAPPPPPPPPSPLSPPPAKDAHQEDGVAKKATRSTSLALSSEIEERGVWIR